MTKELDKKTIEKSTLEENNKKLYESVTDQINVESKDVKLKDLRSTLNEKEKEKIRMIKFLSENENLSHLVNNTLIKTSKKK